ncbi:MAG: sialate O-acetylesterase, partial [Opitutaceae bacterium]|nr:sialate O-acetylesterase [Opitutaceae bacterium]
MKKQTALVLLALAFLAVPARTPLRAALALAPLFTDNAVLQRGRPVAVFGSADPGAEIRVAFAGVTANATAGADGRWHATLPALEASAEPRTLSAASAAGQVAVKNILVGEVWLASGQSNMEWTLRQIGDTAAIAAAANPLVRMARVPLNPQPAPAAALPRPVVWLPATPKNAPVFSATAWFFADEIQRALNVPVGIINAAWGGKMIEVFLSEPVL